MKFAKVVFTVSFSIFLLLGLLPRAMSQKKAPGTTVITYGIEEDANTYIPPPQIQQRPTQRLGVRAAQSQFIVTYNGFTVEARVAFQYAVDIWAALIQTFVPVRITATFSDLGGVEDGFITIGRAGPDHRIVLAGYDVWMVGALADAIAGRDTYAGRVDLTASFNSNDEVNWYYGTDGNTPSGKFDFVTVVLHELGHGLGFYSLARVRETTNNVMEGKLRPTGDPDPYIYDTFVVNGSGTVITTFEDPSAALFAQLTGNNLFWDGTEGKAANSGNRPRLYAPTTWDPGGSYTHLREATFPAGNPNSLMTPILARSEAIHHPGPITLGMFKDMGWTINHAPVFVANTATRSVAENTGADVNIGTPVTAIDANPSDPLTYSLSGTNAASFDIENTSGQLKTKASLNYEAKRVYRVTVTANDGSLEGTIAVTINVTDINDAPVFATNTTTRSIIEGTSANRSIGTPVLATDEDTGDTLTYTLGGTDAASFDIENTTGQLKTKTPLNYETKSIYRVLVIATDTGNLTDFISVTINVIGPVVFADTGLAAAVRSALRISSSAPIPPDVLATLSSLTASRRSITDLTGLEYATDLKSLDLGDNAIVNLSLLSGLTSLESLDLADNQIENVSPLQNLSNLESLDLDDNLIENVFALSGLSHLTRLELRDNDVMDATPLSTMTHLTHLYLRGNENLSNIKRLVKLTSTTIDIDLPDPVNIPDANLAAALRTALGFQADAPIFPEDMETLTTFSAPNESIVNLTGLETATALTTLTLSNNQIVSLSPLSRLMRLTDLDLAENQISSISALSGLTNLTILLLSENRISSVSPLSRLTNLTDLDLSNNQISSVSALSGLTSLTHLLLLNNRIRDVLPLQNLSSLRELNLLGNDNITNIEVLYLLVQGGTNNITPPAGMTIPTNVVRFANTALETTVRSALRIATGYPVLKTKITELTRLTATRKSIDNLTGLEEATGLTDLDLGDNAIVDLGPLWSLPSLEELDLADNLIENVSPLSGLTSLEELDLGDNQIVNVSLQNLSSLESLDLADNLIENVSSLPSLSSLETLDLRDNDVMDATPLSTMIHLTQVYLHGNENLSNIKELVKLKDAGTRIDITLPRPVTFRDDNLVAALRTALGFQADASIFPEDMETLTRFSAPNESIVNLTGLETATALTTLTLSNNQIVSLSPLSRLMRLTDLDLAENQISSISALSGLTSLTILLLSENRISSVSPLSRLTSLTDLDLSNNQISSISALSGLTSLTHLLLLDNQIRDVLPLQNLSSLRELNLLGNDNITNIEVLYLLVQGGTNNITPPAGMTIPTNVVRFANTALETAVRSALRITTGYPILPSKITELTRLTATRKAIADLTGLEQATGLTDLDLGDNAIVDLGPLRNLPSLEELDLADNQIVNLSPLSNLTSLTTLDLDDNQIQDVSALLRLTSLRTLDLRDNDVMDVTPLRDLTSLTYIYLRGNENVTNLEWLGALESLRSDIRLPDVVRIPDTNLDAAVRSALRTAGNTVSNDLPMSEELLESLETLTASNRNIADLSGLEAATELTSLDLQNNRITDVTSLSKLYALETLMLDRNPILDTSVLRELERRGTTIDITIYRYPSWDVNQDGDVDEADVFLITLTLTNESPDVNGDGTVDADDRTAADANKDGSVNTDDILLVFEKQDRPVNLAAPLLSSQDVELDWNLLERIDTGRLRLQLQILHTQNNGTLKYRQAIAFLDAILVAIQPHQTLLLPNYPNPFNPETWLPYQLVRGSDVQITIYDTQGAIIRRLELGYQAEGFYRVRSRAAHWDGRNEVGERVASGVYFYQLETDNVSLLRKMVILK